MTDALKESNLYVCNDKLYLHWPTKSIRLDKYLYQCYHNTRLEQSWFFRCKSAESLINLLENLQARNNTILSRSKLDEIYINYNNEVWAFPTPWKQYQRVKKRYGQKMPKVRRDTVDDILHQQRLIDMNGSKFADWTILKPNSSVIDYAHHLLALTHRPVAHLRIEQIS